MEFSNESLEKKYNYNYRDYFDYWISYDCDSLREQTIRAIKQMVELDNYKIHSNIYLFVWLNIKHFLISNPKLWLLDEDTPFKKLKMWVLAVSTGNNSYYSDAYFKHYNNYSVSYIYNIFENMDSLYKENYTELTKQKEEEPMLHVNEIKEEDFKNNEKIDIQKEIKESKEEPGKKWDQGKLRYDLVPLEPITALAHIYTMGAQKYGDNNWLKGMSYSRLIAAFYRHFYAWLNGEEKDPESGYSPLWHAFWNIAALITYEEKHIGNDDRLIKELEKFKKDTE